MKKFILSVLFCLAGYMTLVAQTGAIRATQIMTGEVRNGQFMGWSSGWISLPSNEQPVLEITEIVSDGEYYYYVTFDYKGEVVDGVYYYDGNKSRQVREEWGKRVVNCYMDEDGAYIYVEGTSLQELSRNPNAWANHSDSIIQFLGKDMNVAIK